MYVDADVKASELEMQQKGFNEEPKPDASEEVWYLFWAIFFMPQIVLYRQKTKHQLKQLSKLAAPVPLYSDERHNN